MLNRSASLAMSTSVLKALLGKLDIKRHSPSILYIFNFLEILRVSCKVSCKVTLQEIQSIHDSMNIPKIKFISQIYLLLEAYSPAIELSN